MSTWQLRGDDEAMPTTSCVRRNLRPVDVPREHDANRSGLPR